MHTRRAVAQGILRAMMIALGLLMAGCTASAPPAYYLLSESSPGQLPGFEGGLAVGVGPIKLPGYLDRNQIVSREGPNKLVLSEANQWAEPLKENLSRLMAVKLAILLNTNRVYELPRRERLRLDYRVTIDIARFDGVLGQDVVLAARWSIYVQDERTPVISKVSHIRESMSTSDYEALVAAQARAAGKMSEEIARAIDSHR